MATFLYRPTQISAISDECHQLATVQQHFPHLMVAPVTTRAKAGQKSRFFISNLLSTPQLGGPHRNTAIRFGTEKLDKKPSYCWDSQPFVAIFRT